MTKNEIYEQVVRLTSELAQTGIAKRIFDVALNEDAVTTQIIIDTFPYYYPELYQEIVKFGKEFNKLVGESEEDKQREEEIDNKSIVLMQVIARSKIINRISEALDTKKPTNIQGILVDFQEEHSGFIELLKNFQEEFDEYWDENKTGREGEIFGEETDEENGVFVFDTTIIDALSFYVLVIFAKIEEVYLFCDDEECSLMSSAGAFYDAIEEATNEAFTEFVASYNIVEWVGKDEEYKTVGEILVDALADRFEESVYVEEDEEE